MSQPFKTNVSCYLFQDMYVHNMKQNTLDTYNLCLNPCSLFLFFLMCTVFTYHSGCQTHETPWLRRWCGSSVHQTQHDLHLILKLCVEKGICSSGAYVVLLSMFWWARTYLLDLLAIEYRLCAFQQKV